MSHRSLGILVSVSLAAGCAPATQEEPTWVVDVRPILAANCVRCHGSPARNDAPPTFRLDVLEDVGAVKGARSMAEFVAARTAGRGDMPAEGPALSERQKQVLWAWQFTTAAGKRPANHLPEATMSTADGEEGGLDVLVADADRDIVIGQLKVDSAVVAPLRTGNQRVVVDTSGLAAGTRAVSAIIDDGEGPISVDLGTIEVAHENAVPRIEILAPLPDDLFVAGETTKVVFRASDADPAEALVVDLVAVLPGMRLTVATGVVPQPSGVGEVPFDTTALPEGESWQIEATISDGKASRTVSSSPFIVSHATTADTYDELRPLINEICRPCHSRHLPTGPNFDRQDELQRVRGRAWRKLFQRREMPPPSASEVIPELRFAEEDRDRLAAWFYAGAP